MFKNKDVIEMLFISYNFCCFFLFLFFFFEGGDSVLLSINNSYRRLEVFQLFSIYARKNAYVFTYRVVPLIKISIFKKLILFLRKIQC